jgi:hypothetical protein
LAITFADAGLQIGEVAGSDVERPKSATGEALERIDALLL